MNENGWRILRIQREIRRGWFDPADEAKAIRRALREPVDKQYKLIARGYDPAEPEVVEDDT